MPQSIVLCSVSVVRGFVLVFLLSFDKCQLNIPTDIATTFSMYVPPQEVLTKDSMIVTVDAVVYYRVYDP